MNLCVHSLRVDLYADRWYKSMNDSHANRRLNIRIVRWSESEDTQMGNDGVIGRPCIKCMWWYIRRSPSESGSNESDPETISFSFFQTATNLLSTEVSWEPNHVPFEIWGYSSERLLDDYTHFGSLCSLNHTCLLVSPHSSPPTCVAKESLWLGTFTGLR